MAASPHRPPPLSTSIPSPPVLALSVGAVSLLILQSRVRRLAFALPGSLCLAYFAHLAGERVQIDDAAALRATYISRRDAARWDWRGTAENFDGGGSGGGSGGAPPSADEAAAVRAHLRGLTRNALPRVVPREARDDAAHELLAAAAAEAAAAAATADAPPLTGAGAAR